MRILGEECLTEGMVRMPEIPGKQNMKGLEKIMETFLRQTLVLILNDCDFATVSLH